MKRSFTLVLSLLCAINWVYGTIVFTNIVDETLTANGSIAINFDNTGADEFSITNSGFAPEIVPTFFFTGNNIIETVSTTQWDVLAGLPISTPVGPTNGWHSFGDAYLDPFWAMAPFPTGSDVFFGARFELNGNTHYGWARVNWDPVTDLFILKSYAYEDVPDMIINTGDEGIPQPNEPEIEVLDAAMNNLANNANLDLGTTAVGTPVTQTLRIGNTGIATLNLSNPTLSGPNAADFSITVNPNNMVLPAGNTSFTISYNPAAAGVSNAVLNIVNNDTDEDPFIINLSATATMVQAPMPEIDVLNGTNNIANNGNLTLGTTVVGTPLGQTITIENTGTDDLTLTNPIISGANAADFSIAANPNNTVLAGANTSFSINYNPAAAGTSNAVITIANNDADEDPFVINISAMATMMIVNEPEIEVLDGANSITNNGSISLGVANFGVSIVQSITINNTGNQDLTLSNPSISGPDAADFSITANPNNTVLAGASTSFDISFISSVAGLKNATINIANNDTDESPFIFNVSVDVENLLAVNAINVTINDNDSTFFQGTSKSLSATVLPVDALNPDIVWSIIDLSGSATINQQGEVFGISGGLVKARATAADGSGVSDEVTLFIIQNAVSIENVSAFQNLEVYPNPTQDFVYINTSESISLVRVLDVLGNIKLSESKKIDTFDLSNFSSGVYFIQIFNENNESKTIKLIRN